MVMVCQVAHAGKGMRGKLPIPTNLDKIKRPQKMPLSYSVLSGIVCHPSGHFCQRRC
jgi:hypothetical protein